MGIAAGDLDAVLRRDSLLGGQAQKEIFQPLPGIAKGRVLQLRHEDAEFIGQHLIDGVGNGAVLLKKSNKIFDRDLTDRYRGQGLGKYLIAVLLKACDLAKKIAARQEEKRLFRALGSDEILSDSPMQKEINISFRLPAGFQNGFGGKFFCRRQDGKRLPDFSDDRIS